MKTKKYNQRQKKHKPNLKGPYSVDPQDKIDTDFPEADSKRSKKEEKQDPAIIDRQE